MTFVTLPAGERVPAFGMGTWYVGEDPAARAEEIATLRLGLDLGAHLIDTAEMYGEGLAEELVGEAIAGRRDEVFLVSKVYPHNATRAGAAKACERSLRRLRTDRIDLYLLHWRNTVPLAETLEAVGDHDTPRHGGTEAPRQIRWFLGVLGVSVCCNRASAVTNPTELRFREKSPA